MLYIPTKLESLKDGSVKVRTLANLSKGDTVWGFHSSTTQVFWKKHFIAILRELPIEAIKSFLHYSYIKEGNIYLRNDNSRFICHSLEPNLVFNDCNLITSISDINEGDELLLNHDISYDKNNYILKAIINSKLDKREILQRLNKSIAVSGRPQSNFLVS